MPPLTGDILRVGAVHPETIGPHCLAMLPRSNASSCGAATTLQVALHGRKGRRAACACTARQHALICAKHAQCAKHAKLRNLSGAALILGARSPRTRPRARARARAILKNHAAHFSPTESLEQKSGNLLLMCAQWTNLGGVIFQFFEKLGFFEKCFLASYTNHHPSYTTNYPPHTNNYHPLYKPLSLLYKQLLLTLMVAIRRHAHGRYSSPRSWSLSVATLMVAIRRHAHGR